MTQCSETLYSVVISEDARYAIWPTRRTLPWGWRPEGFEGARAECLAHVETLWTELSPAKAEGAA